MGVGRQGEREKGRGGKLFLWNETAKRGMGETGKNSIGVSADSTGSKFNVQCSTSRACHSEPNNKRRNLGVSTGIIERNNYDFNSPSFRTSHLDVMIRNPFTPVSDTRSR